MKRVSLSIIVLLIIGCPVLFPTFKDAGAQVIELKLAHQWPQKEDDYIIQAGIKFADAVKNRTDGQIKIRFYPAQSLVKAMDTPEALSRGAVDMTIFPPGYMTGIVPLTSVVTLPGLAGTHDTLYAFKDSEMNKMVEKALNKFGMKTIGWMQFCGGMGSSKEPPITSLGHIAGRVWRSGGTMIDMFLNHLGGSTVSIPSTEIYTSMQRGVINTAFTSSRSWVSYRLYEVIKNYTSPEEYSLYIGPESLYISIKTWNKLTDRQQKIILKAGDEVSQWALEAVKKEDKNAADFMRSKGVNVVQCPKSLYMDYIGKAKPYWPEILKKLIPSVAEREEALNLLDKFVKTGK